METHNWEDPVSDRLTDTQLLHELEPVAERLLNRHLALFKEWHPHDYVPWSDGRNFYALDGQDWEPGTEPAFRRGTGRDGAKPADRRQFALVSP